MKTRREILKGSAAVVPSGGGVVTASADAALDLELLEREKELGAAIANWRVLSDVWNEAEARFFAVAPRVPTLSSFCDDLPPELRAEYENITHGELETIKRVAPDHPLAKWDRIAQERYNRGAALNESIEAERERLHTEMGVTAADEAQSEAFDECSQLAYAILDMPAAGFVGLIVKLRVQATWLDYDEGADATLSALRIDIASLAGVEPIPEPADVTDHSPRERED